jgi:DNA gyrase subunit A
MADNVQPVSLVDETRKRYLTYAHSVIVARALPDVRDGLKPVQRRILFTMYHDLHLHADAQPRKCAKIIGDVTGNYHPHGNEAAYDALVRLAQDFVMRQPLVYGQGNFGSVDGDPPAAYRYTEAKLTAVADHLLSELRQETVPMRDNYDGTHQEPVVLPAQFPNLLVNGSSGIAVGLATNIPPHNLGEVVRACIYLIDNPDATTAVLLDRVKGPDFPLGGRVIASRTVLRQIYEDGSGSIKVQGEWKLEESGKKPQIIITSIPYGVNKSALESEIGALIEAKKLPQLTSVVNEMSGKAGLRISMDIKNAGDAPLVMAYLYKHTALQQNFAYNLTCLVPGPDGSPRPERLGLKAILRHFLDFRLQTVKKRFEYELAQLRKRIHILEGFKILFDDLDKALKLIRNSNGKADAAEKLMAAFPLDGEQTTAILDSQLYKIAQMEIKKILDELRERKKKAKEIEELLGSEPALWAVIKEELTELAAQHADRRRTTMGGQDDVPEFDPQAYIVRENTNVVLTRDGWVKRVGRLASVETTRVREGDAVIAVAPASTTSTILFPADDGTMYTMLANEVPASSGYGEPVPKFFKLADQVRVLTAISGDERFTPLENPAANGDPAGPYLLALSAFGQVLRTPLLPFRTESTKAGRRYMRLAEGDKVVFTAVVTDVEKLLLATTAFHVLQFAVSEVNIVAGVAKGVMAVKMNDDERCLGAVLVTRHDDALEVETSAGKIVTLTARKYQPTSRGGRGHAVQKRTTLVRILPPPIELVDWDNLDKDDNGQPTLFE